MTTATCARNAVAICVDEEELLERQSRRDVDAQLRVLQVEPPGAAVEAPEKPETAPEPETAPQPDAPPEPEQAPEPEMPDGAEAAGAARRFKRGIVWLALMGVLVAIVLTSVPGLDSVTNKIGDASTGWLILALVFELLSCAGFVLAFQLVFNRAPFRFAARVAWVEMAFGAVLPAGGAGGLAVGAWILYAKGFPLRRVASRSAVLFLLTSAVNLGVLAISGLALATDLVPGPHGALLGWVPAAVGVGTLAFFLLLPRIAGRVDGSSGRAASWLTATAGVVRETTSALRSRDWRLLGAVGYLLFDIAVLWACFKAFGSSPPIAAIVLGYQIGYLANIVPIPGGIGVLDGGLIGALLLYGTPATATAAAVLIYHAIALWVPTLIGAFEFWLVRRSFDQPVILKPAAQPH